MCPDESHENHPPIQPHCCPCCDHSEESQGDRGGVSRRGFIGGVSGIAMAGLSWSALSAAQVKQSSGEPSAEPAPPRKTLVVKPIFVYSVYQRRPQTSWRPWGGIQTQADADKEVKNITAELKALESRADFPVKFQNVAAVQDQKAVAALKADTSPDVYLIYAAGGSMPTLTDAIGLADAKDKDAIVFLRHRSGPVYLWYEIMSPRYLRRHSDKLAVENIDFDDVVVDNQDDILWRLRALCGLRNTVGSRILAVGGPGAWAQPKGKVDKLVKDRWQLDVRTITYNDLGKLIEAARKDQAAVKDAKNRAAAYLKTPGTKLETKLPFVENAFLLESIFRALMKKADCRAMTINSCMGTIMPMSQTTACLPLSTLNDDGYLAFCESDFVVIPSGILLGSISGCPTFLNDPTHPHHNMITLAHCTAPRRMDGKTLEPASIMTHFESDYGAAPKVDMHVGQELTCIAPDFDAKRWLGLSAEIVAHPLLPICRSQIDVKFKADSDTVAKHMPGFHWMVIYGNYLREAGYALKRVGIEWENLG
ncbi:MAG: hypothetical protein JXM70_23130 [Pirellulales bacterium]|nr:hypothetical protein [Pirellulales bacterium]